ncbi:MAG: STAS domain-containing protein [Gammaproteobacteria bacterium]|nr:STAS domain-containing protein [Gammaproteobacteria bacterium]
MPDQGPNEKVEDAQEGQNSLDNGELIFDSLLDITMVAKYYEILNELLNDPTELALNAEKVERIDGAGLQLLVSFIKEAEKVNLPVKWSGVSQVFDTAAKTAALENDLKYVV